MVQSLLSFTLALTDFTVLHINIDCRRKYSAPSDTVTTHPPPGNALTAEAGKSSLGGR